MRAVGIFGLALLAACSEAPRPKGAAGSGAGQQAWLVELVPPSVVSRVPIELEVASIPAGVELRLPTVFSVRGRVLEADGRPVVAHVTVWRASKIPGRPAHVVETGDAGDGFELALPADRYTVRVNTKGTPARPAYEYSVDLGGSNTAVTLSLPPPTALRSVTGTVAQVIDSANRIPIEGLSVKAVDRATGRVASTTTATGVDGGFRLQIWNTAGIYDLVVAPTALAPGFPTLRRTFDTALMRQDARGDYAVGLLPMPQHVSPRQYRFSVRGSPENGADVPVVGSTVTLETTLVSAVDAAASELPAAEFFATGQADSSGFVELMLLPPEQPGSTRRYALRVQPPVGSPFAGVEEEAFPLEATTGRAQEFRLRSKVRLSGAVRSADGRPIANAVVDAFRARDGSRSLGVTGDGVSATATTDASGMYLLRVDLGRFDVEITPPQGGPWPRESRENVVIAGGLDLPVDLAAGNRTSGRILTEPGGTLPRVEVRFYLAAPDGKSAARLRGVAESDDDGAFEVVLP